MKRSEIEGPLETAVRLLARRDHTERQMIEKLRRREFSDEQINETIISLKDRGYLDDARLGQLTLEKMVEDKRYGSRGISNKLKELGLAQITENTIRQHYPEEAEWDVAVKLLKRKFPVWDGSTFSRMARFLTNRGFASPIISKLSQECRKRQ